MRHAVITNNIVTNLIAVEPGESHLFSSVELSDDSPVDFGWRYIDGEFLPPEFDPIAEAEKIRTQRNNLLEQTDVMVLLDRWNRMTPEQQTAWSNYRQALRDLPLQENFPQEVVWPVAPEN